MPAKGNTVTSAWAISNTWRKQVSEISQDWRGGIMSSPLGEIHPGPT